MASYASVEEIKASLSDSLGAGVTKYDTILSTLAIRASRYIDAIFNKPADAFLASGSSARLFNGNNQPLIHIDEIVSVETVEASFDGLAFIEFAAGTYNLMPYNLPPYWGIQTAFNNAFGYFPRGNANVRVTGIWGFSTAVPDLIKQATIIQATRWWKRGQSAYGDAFSNQLTGGLEFVKGIDPDVKIMMESGNFSRLAL